VVKFSYTLTDAKWEHVHLLNKIVLTRIAVAASSNLRHVHLRAPGPCNASRRARMTLAWSHCRTLLANDQHEPSPVRSNAGVGVK